MNKSKKAIIVNLYGVPSAGKSTGCAYIFSMLKMCGINVEQVTEFAKDKVWEESKEVFNNQLYILGKQSFRISRCEEKVDVIVTDSPMMLSMFYNQNNPKYGEEFNELVRKLVKNYDTIDYLLTRVKSYNPKGRFQTEEESNALAEPMRKMLDDNNVNYKCVSGDVFGYHNIIIKVLENLGDDYIKKYKEILGNINSIYQLM